MADYWVVSPNVNSKPKRLKVWKEFIISSQAAFMGYDEGHPLGRKFDRVPVGDIILVAHRQNYEWRLLCCGRVASMARADLTAPFGYGKYLRLNPFENLYDRKPSEYGVPFNHVTSSNAQTVKAIFRLNLSNLADKKLAAWLDKRLSKHSPAVPGSFAEAARIGGRAKPKGWARKLMLEYQFMTKSKLVRACRSEEKLTEQYEQWLRALGRRAEPYSYDGGVWCDLYEPERKHLIEAKSSAGRDSIRTAIGQLFDYELLGRNDLGKSSMAVLLPQRPERHLENLLDSLQISVIWRQGQKFCDNARGKFVN